MRTTDRRELLKDGQCNWELGLARFAHDALDTSEDALDCWANCRVGRQAGIGVEGADAGKIGLDCVGLEAAIGKVGNPLRNGLKAGGEIDARGGENLGIKCNIIEIRSLPG